MYRVREGTDAIVYNERTGDVSPYTTQKEFLAPVNPDLWRTLVLLPGGPFWNVKSPPVGFSNHYAFKQHTFVLIVKPEDVEFLFPQF